MSQQQPTPELQRMALAAMEEIEKLYGAKQDEPEQGRLL